jgi:predicted transposase/invertase (TIGR01784 family)
MSLLYTEWNMDDALAVRYEEGHEDGIELGIERGIEQGREEGLIEGKLIIARNLLAKGMSCEFVQEITGLDLETIQTLSG